MLIFNYRILCVYFGFTMMCNEMVSGTAEVSLHDFRANSGYIHITFKRFPELI